MIQSDYPRISTDEITSELAVKGALSKEQLAGDDSPPKVGLSRNRTFSI